MQAGRKRRPSRFGIILVGEVGGFSFRPSSKEHAHVVIVGVEVEIAVSLRRDAIFHEKYKFRRSETYVFAWALGVEL